MHSKPQDSLVFTTILHTITYKQALNQAMFNNSYSTVGAHHQKKPQCLGVKIFNFLLHLVNDIPIRFKIPRKALDYIQRSRLNSLPIFLVVMVYKRLLQGYSV